MINTEKLKTPELAFRKGSDSDIAFIYSSWLRSFRETNNVKGFGVNRPLSTGPALYEHDMYFKGQRELIGKILSVSETLICVNPEDHDHAYGYVVYRDLTPEVRVISWIYIKHPFRRFGLARALYEKIEPAHVVTHGSPMVRGLIQKLKLVYDPYVDFKLLGGK